MGFFFTYPLYAAHGVSMLFFALELKVGDALPPRASARAEGESPSKRATLLIPHARAQVCTRCHWATFSASCECQSGSLRSVCRWTCAVPVRVRRPLNPRASALDDLVAAFAHRPLSASTYSARARPIWQPALLRLPVRSILLTSRRAYGYSGSMKR